MNTQYFLTRTYIVIHLFATICFLSFSIGLSHAENTKNLAFELNNAQQMANSCRLSFLIQNKMPAAIEALTLEIVLFTKQDQVDQFLKLKAGALPKGKMRVKQFDLKGKNCGDLSRILINEIAECKGEALSPASCLSALAISSRTAIKLQL